MTDKFRLMFIEDFTPAELMNTMSIPHYTNEHRWDFAQKCFDIRVVNVPYGDRSTNVESIMVVWRQSDGRPTDAEVIAAAQKLLKPV